MFGYPTRFRNEEDGAVTVDWVVVTAAIAGIGVALVLNIQAGATDTADGIGNFVSEQRVLLD
ncbi:MAG: hypothetical protein AAF771_10605 [Pseudomonadota bacterium]